MITKSLAIRVINAGLATGADFAEIFLEEKQTSVISLENGDVDTINSGKTYGAGIRLLKNLQSVYGYTNDISIRGLLNLAESLAKSFNGQQEYSVKTFYQVKVPNRHGTTRPLHEVSKKEKIALLKEISNAITTFDKRIVRASVGLSDNTQNVVIFNSKEKLFKDTRSRGRLFMSAIASDDGVIETAFSGPGAQKGFEYFTEDLDMIKHAKEVAQSAITKLTALECPSGKMPVVIGNGFGGVIFHEACGHALEASAVSKGLSVFAGKLGKQIASPLVTAIDDGTIANAWGSSNIDDEGNKTIRNVLIEKGILKNYLIDDFNGRRMKTVGNGATRRQSYAYEPTSRMSNTYIAAGNSTPEEIIKATKLGLYAKSLGGGSVNPATGDFNFAVEEAYLIRNGKIAEAVKGATLIGTGAEVLMKIDMVGNDLKRAQGMCGASSGSIPTDVGQPTIRVSEITVGGRGGALK